MAPYKEKPITKLYYSIGEVAKMFDVNTSLVRFWEKEFDILKPKKNKKGNRLFTQKDVDNLKVIYHLVKERGFTLDGAKKKLRENKDDTIQNEQIVERLKEIRGFLVELRDNL
jgi:DNA-binding transcriptional MerR regulator